MQDGVVPFPGLSRVIHIRFYQKVKKKLRFSEALVNRVGNSHSPDGVFFRSSPSNRTQRTNITILFNMPIPRITYLS